MILVADDNSNIQKMVTNALKDKGIEVIGVANGDAAIKKLEILNPDMVLADVFMPVKDGYELCEWIKGNQRLASVPVFLLVGAFDPLDEHRVQAVKADGVLKKPFVPPDNLIGAVMAMLERGAKSRAAAEMASTHTEFASSVPSAEETQKLPDLEVEEMTKQPAPAVEPEPEMEMYATRPARLAFDETDQPVGLDDALGAPTSEEAESEEPAFRASSTEAAEQASGHDIVEEMRQPSPDLPPIKVDFSGGGSHELVTSDSPEGYASMSAVDGAPLGELVGSGEDIARGHAAEPPPPPPPPAAEMSVPEVRMPEPEPEPEPAASPLGMASAELPGLSWSERAHAEVASQPPPAPPAYSPPPPHPAPVAAAAAPAPVTTPEIVPRAMPLSPAQQEALVDEIVERVVSQIQPMVIHRVTTEISKGLEMLQPQLLERISKEVVRPLAEDLLRKKTDE